MKIHVPAQCQTQTDNPGKCGDPGNLKIKDSSLEFALVVYVLKRIDLSKMRI
jgi:hypothetical protein